jgi:hypothetical protein
MIIKPGEQFARIPAIRRRIIDCCTSRGGLSSRNATKRE